MDVPFLFYVKKIERRYLTIHGGVFETNCENISWKYLLVSSGFVEYKKILLF